MADETARRRPVVGLALGSGSARGWAHIGVIQALEALGVAPQVVVGTSIGALVGAVYVSGHLEAFAGWIKTLTVRDVVGLMDFTLAGGMVKGNKLFGHIRENYPDAGIETLPIRYASVATDMATGREHWIQHGSVMRAARASCALPGVFTPVESEGRWMLDGGLVNPVPVSTCRALGAEVVIAVNLNGELVGRHFSDDSRREVERTATAADAADVDGAATIEEATDEAEAGGVRSAGWWRRVRGYLGNSDATLGRERAPGLFDVIATSVNIMQDRITRSRMAGDPPDVTLVPHLKDFALMDFHRAGEAIEEGHRLVAQQADEIRYWAKL
ncbi:MAG: patatin [Nevskiaceae bacterium]|nr:MAG: patatin [Nevskiaceae bacterium]TBR72015.1 MAG: patatin [Nevskiaceae bacterium]